MKRLFAFGLGLLLVLWSFAVVACQNPIGYDWKAFGHNLYSKKNRLDAAFAKKVATTVADQMARMQVPVNNSRGGRLGSAVRFGQQDIGTCSWINAAIQDALIGAGFGRDQVFMVVAVGQGAIERGVYSRWDETVRAVNNHLQETWNLNVEHVSPAVVIGGEVLTFDLWNHAAATNGYTGLSGSVWNGRPFLSWCDGMGTDYVEWQWARYQSIPNVPQGAKYAREAILEDQFRQKYPGVKPKKPAKQPVKPQPKKAAFVPHWKLIEVKPVPEKVWPDAVNRALKTTIVSAGGRGTLKVTTTWNDPNGSVHSCWASVTWQIIGDIEKLIPDMNLQVKGSVDFGGEIMRSGVYVPNDMAPVGMHWHPPGFEAHVGHVSGIKFLEKEIRTHGGEFELTPFTVPKLGNYQDGKMVLRVLTYARGYGAVEYIYQWVDKPTR